MDNRSVATVIKGPKAAMKRHPTVIVEYNQFLGGVDLVDQHLSYYLLTQRRTIKWWKKVFWCLIDIAIILEQASGRLSCPVEEQLKSKNL